MIDKIQVFLKSGRILVGSAGRNSLRVLAGPLWLHDGESVIIIPINNIDYIKSIPQQQRQHSFSDNNFEDTLANLDKFQDLAAPSRSYPYSINDNRSPQEQREQQEMPIAVVTAPTTRDQIQSILDYGPPEVEGQGNYDNPLSAIITSNIPEAVRKAEEIILQTKSGVDSDELAGFTDETRHSEEENDEEPITSRKIIALFDAGLTVAMISDQTGIDERSIARVLNDSDRISKEIDTLLFNDEDVGY